MAETKSAQKYVGKVIIVGDDVATITIKGVKDNGNLDGEFKRGDNEPIPMPVTLANLQAMLERGVWRIEGEATATETKATETKSEDEVEEVQEVVPPKHEPKAEKKAAPKGEKSKDKPKKEEPKAKAEPKPKTEKAKPNVQASGKLVYETYTSSRGKACARILGFGEKDAAYVNAAEIHGSASWVTTDGKRTLYVAFGPKYAAAAKYVCDALNAGKTFEDCKAIIEGTPQPTATKPEGKTYTEAEVLDLLKRVADGDAAALAMVDAMAKKAA